MPATHTYSPIFHVPATARTQLAPTCRYAQYAETPTPLALVGGSAKRCAFRGMTVVARSEAKGEMGGGNLGGVTWRGARRPYFICCSESMECPLFFSAQLLTLLSPSPPKNATPKPAYPTSAHGITAPI